MRRIFICYRRDDTAGHAGRLYDHLRAHFGDDQVFIDINAIDPGVEYPKLIDSTLGSIDVALVLIGRRWLDARDPSGGRRLDDPEDMVRMEISAALNRDDVLVIPVLVQGATMPHPNELPPDIAGLARRNALEISDARWDFDADRLARALRGTALEDGTPAAAAPRGGGAVVAVRWWPTGLAIAGLLVFTWGTLMPRTYHNELWPLRAGVGLITLALSVAGIRWRRWRWVLLAGIIGVVGFAMWLLQLLSNHSAGDLFSRGQDGIPNAVTMVGALLVLVSGVVGMRAESRA